MTNIYIDGDELVYKATVPKTIYKRGLWMYSSKKQAVEQVGSMEHVTRSLLHPNPVTIHEQLKNMVGKIVWQCERNTDSLDLTSIFIVFSSSTNFRKGRYPDYKANRKQPKPKMYGTGVAYLRSHYICIDAIDEEADDRMVIEREKNGGILASSDKDFLTVPGQLYNIMKGTFTDISKWDASYNFYTQVLVGDRADNVQGCKGIGPKKAAKILDNGGGDRDFYVLTRKAYEAAGQSYDEMDKAGFLLHLRRFEGEIFHWDKLVDRFTKASLV